VFSLRKRHIINLAKFDYFTVFGVNINKSRANNSKALAKEMENA